MLSQDDVTDAACRFLTEAGWDIRSKKVSRSRDDTVAEKPGHRLVVHAKGEGSATRGTNRYGSTFTRSQARHHVAVAAASALASVAQGRDLAALALPDNADHQDAVRPIAPALHRLGIGVLFVGADRTVRAEAPWEV